MDPRGAARRDDLLGRRIGAGVTQVRADRLVEQVGILGYHADRRMEGVPREVAHVAAVHTDGTTGHVVQPRNE